MSSLADNAVVSWFRNAWAWVDGDLGEFQAVPLYNAVVMTPELFASGHWFNLSQAAPALDPLYPFAFENDFTSGGKWADFARRHPLVPVAICALYVVVVFGLKAWMRSRPALRVRRAWIWWNALLSAFSWCGALRVVPHLAVMVYTRGFTASFCSTSAQAYVVCHQ
jgi:hypothetical protein